jgi:putative flippase GtrA
MVIVEWFRGHFPSAAALIEARSAFLRKAITFAFIGVINTAVDAAIFYVAYTQATTHAEPLRFFTSLAGYFNNSVADMTLIVCNVFSWFIAISGSYVMNSTVTFAAVTGRRLSWRAWGTFVGSGVFGAVANTTTLVIAAKFLPVWAAKGCAILVSFMFNFSMSHFVVFRPRKAPAIEAERNS